MNMILAIYGRDRWILWGFRSGGRYRLNRILRGIVGIRLRGFIRDGGLGLIDGLFGLSFYNTKSAPT